MDDKPIFGIDIPTNSTRSGTPSIVLNGRGKCKRSEIKSKSLTNDAEPSNDVVLLASYFKELIAVLVVVLRDSRNLVVLTVLLVPKSKVLDNRIDKVKVELKNEMREM